MVEDLIKKKSSTISTSSNQHCSIISKSSSVNHSKGQYTSQGTPLSKSVLFARNKEAGFLDEFSHEYVKLLLGVRRDEND